MEDKRNQHLKVQELCDCFATNNYNLEVTVKTENEDGGQLLTFKSPE